MAQRLGRIDERTSRNAVLVVEELYAELLIVGIDDELARSAGELAAQYGLRGYDAVHLASAISIEDPSLVTITWDEDLAKAALACGNTVAP